MAVVVGLVLIAVQLSKPADDIDVDALNAQAASAVSSAQSVDDAAETARTAVFIGDSYTAAAGASTGKGFTTDLAAAEGWVERNLGRGGTGYFLPVKVAAMAKSACGLTYCPRYGEMIAAAVALHPGIVVVSGGRNDVAVSAAAEAKAIHDFYTELRQALPNARIIATSPLWGSTEPPANLAAMASQVQDAVRSVAGTYLNIGQPLSGKPNWIISDGVHPNDKGHAAIAAAIQEALLTTSTVSTSP